MAAAIPPRLEARGSWRGGRSMRRRRLARGGSRQDMLVQDTHKEHLWLTEIRTMRPVAHRPQKRVASWSVVMVSLRPGELPCVKYD